MPRASCTACGRLLEAPAESAGQKGRCPFCGKTFRVPLLLINPGGAIAGSYTVIRPPAAGGNTWICMNGGGNTCAVKAFPADELREAGFLERLESSARAWVSLGSHPRIATAFSYGRSENYFFIAVQYSAPDEHGRNNLLHYGGLLSDAELAEISMQVCFALEFAYSKGVKAHGAINPADILVTSRKSALLTDIGIYARMDAAGERYLPYAAPENAEGVFSELSDVYSFGATLFHVVTGEPPVPAGERTSSGADRDDFFKSGAHPLIPVIEKCMALEPDERYTGFSAIRRDLWHLLAGKDKPGGDGKSLLAPTAEFSLKGYGLESADRFLEAIECYDLALRISPGDPIALKRKAACLFSMGRYDRAVECYDMALSGAQDDSDAWFLKGVALSRLGKEQEALECFDRSLEFDPGNIRAWEIKGEVLDRRSRYSEALECYEHALALNPGDAVSLAGKGETLLNIGKYKDALTALERAVESDPGNVMARRLLKKLKK